MRSLFFIILFLSATPYQTMAAPPALMALGNQIVTVVGHCPVRLKGVDVPGMEWSNVGDGPVSANRDLTTVQEAVNNWGCNFVRLPLNQDRWLGTACGSNGTSYQALVQGIVDWCNSNNVYVLLDLHWSDLGTAGSGLVCTQGQHDLPDNNSLLFWQNVAAKAGIANNPAVFFDLYNEPGGATGTTAVTNDTTGWALWRNGGTVPATSDGISYASPGMQGLLSAIRTAGANNLVWAGGIDWAFNLSGIATYSAALTDTPAGNGVVYATHIYPFKWGGNGCVVAACFDSAVPANVMSTYPVMVTEFGPNVGDPEGFVNPLIAWINLHNLSYCAWSMHPGAAPCLITNWSYTPTAYFGTPLRNAFLGTNPMGCNPATNTPSPTVTPSPTALPACGNTVIFRINCAGTNYTDANGDLWSADSNFSGGTTSSTTVTVQGTTDPALFMTNRWGSPLGYSFSVPNGTYLVKILESENYWKAAGKRVFSISLQGSTVLSNYDIFASTGGIDQAVTLTYTATVTTGSLNLVATASVDNAQFAAIQITWVGPACSSSPTASPSFSVSPTISPTPSISPTFTVSPTSSVSPSTTPTPTISPTFSVSPTFTVSPTVTPTGTVTSTFTVTYTAIQFVGPLLILNGAGVPNPNPSALLVQLSRPADSISADFYSVSLTRVLQVRLENCTAGYNTLYLSQAWAQLPNGVYFVRVTAQLGAKAAPSRILKLTKLR